MFCDSCGNPVQPGQKHCTGCGKQVLGRPLLAGRDRVARHRQTLGILWIAYSAISLVSSVALFIIANTYGQLGRSLRPDVVLPHLPAYLRPLTSFLAILLLTKAVAGIIAGVGVLQCHPWARVLALVVGFLSLLNIPLGTAVGIYTLWVLLAPKAGEEYRAMAKAASA